MITKEGITMVNKKYRYVIIVVGFNMIYTLNGCMTASSQIRILMDNNTEIQSVTEIWGWNGEDIDFNGPLVLDIRLSEERRLFLGYIQSKHILPAQIINKTPLNAPFDIYLIGDTAFCFFEHVYLSNGKEFVNNGSNLPVALLAQEIGIQLDTVDDVIKNYDKIYKFVSLFPKWRHSDRKKETPFKNIEFAQYAREGYALWQLWRIVRSDEPDYYGFKHMDEVTEYEKRRIYQQ
jgi:hypothetical protein